MAGQSPLHSCVSRSFPLCCLRISELHLLFSKIFSELQVPLTTANPGVG